MIKAEEKSKLEKIFADISENGYLIGSKAKELMLQTSIPVDILAQIWDMSDIDKDGSLNQNEFIISMYLINKAKAGNMPDFLPREFYQSLGVLNYPLSPNIALSVNGSVSQNNNSAFSLIGSVEGKLSDSPENIFTILDSNKDNLVDGTDCKNIFLSTKLPQLLLAQIWNICDVNQTGSLDLDHFRLAWYLINHKLKNGIDPPSQFYPELLELSKNSARVNNVLTEEDYKEIPGGLQVLNLMKEIAEIENEKAVVEKLIEQRSRELREKNETYQSLKHEVELVLESVKMLESGKEGAQHKLDESILEEKRQRSTLEDVKAECAKIEVEIAELNKRGNVSGQNGVSPSKSIENLLKEETLLKEQIKASEKLKGFNHNRPYVNLQNNNQMRSSFDSNQPVAFNPTFDDAFGFTSAHKLPNGFHSSKGKPSNTPFNQDPFMSTNVEKHDLFAKENSNYKTDFSFQGFDEDPFAPKGDTPGGFDAFAKFDAF